MRLAAVTQQRARNDKPHPVEPRLRAEIDATHRADMSLGDITGVFSRFFVVGFFIPSVAVIAAFDQIFEGSVEEAHLLLIGGLAVGLALLVLGLQTPIWSLFEGYPHSDKDGFRKAAYWTRFGEETRQYRTRGCRQWGFDTWTVWPYVEALFSEREREIHVDQLANVRFFLNTSIGAFAVAGGFVVNAFLDDPAFDSRSASLLAAVGCTVLSRALYLGAVTAVSEWGDYKVASVGLHRRELFELLGLAVPPPDEDQRSLAGVVNALLVKNRQPGETLSEASRPRSEDEPKQASSDGMPCERQVGRRPQDREHPWQIWGRPRPREEWWQLWRPPIEKETSEVGNADSSPAAQGTPR